MIDTLYYRLPAEAKRAYEVEVLQSLHELAEALGDGLVTDPAVVDGYRRDRAAWAEAGEPLALARPASTEEVQAIARWATRHRIPLVPRGAGSGISGGANASDGALIVSFERMQQIVEIDPAAMLARVHEAVGKLSGVAAEKGIPVSQLALGWVLGRPAIASVIIGPRTPEQLRDNLAALNVKFAPEELARIDAISPPGGHIVPFYDADFGPHLQRTI